MLSINNRKYKINYYQYGGSKKLWPPKINSLIEIKRDNNLKVWKGNVINYIWNDTAAVVKLTKVGCNANYREISLQQYDNYNNGIGYLLLLPSYEWNYSKSNTIPNKLNNIKKKDNKKYFTETKIDLYLNENTENFNELSEVDRNILLEKLKNFESVKTKELVVNRSVAVNNLITELADIKNESKKIIDWMKQKFDEVFLDLVYTEYNGYVYLSRKGLNTSDTVTNNLVPKLNYFSWQEGKPIDYQTLKYIIFQNEFQKSLSINQNQKLEAEAILALENIIALQPKPEYQLWCVKRLLMIWYGDKEIQLLIRKIKILINQYRADPTKKYNKENGIFPSIVIYPRYGRIALKTVLSKIRYYFSMYIDEDSNTTSDVNWTNSKPSYFIKDNELIYHTNGSTDIKLYIQDSINNNSTLIIDSFNENMTKFTNEREIL